MKKTPAAPPTGSGSPPRYSDEMIPLISRVLRAGVMVSSLVLVAGLALFISQSPAIPPVGPVALTHFAVNSVHGVSHRNLVIITTGLWILILTPVARVAMGLWGYMKEKDRALTVTTSYVLAVLIASFFLGRS